MPSKKRRRILGVVIATAAAVAGVEIAAHATRAAHNREAAHLGDRLYVEVSGKGEPILFIHGFRGSGRYWQPHVQKLAADHQVIVVDLLGFGHSRWPEDSPYDVAEHIQAVHRTVSPIIRDRRMIVVGHSAGSVLAAAYAQAYASQVQRVVLLNAPMFRSPEEGREKIRAMSPMAEMFSAQRIWARASCDLVCAFRPLLFRIAPRLEPDVPPHVARDAVLHSWRSFDRTLRKVVLESRLEETLRSIRPLPVTIIHGTKDEVTSRERLEAIAEEISAKLFFIEGDHNLYLKSADEVLGHVTNPAVGGVAPASQK